MAVTTYSYIARDSSGRTREGTVAAPNIEAVQDRLAELSLTAVSIKEHKVSLSNMEIKIPGLGGVGASDLAIFSRQFATMIDSGLPLVRALTILASQSTHPKMREVITEMVSDVRSGKTLSDSMKNHPSVFPPIFISMCHAGEISGQLDQVLTRVAITLEKEVALRRKVKSALTYPVVVLVLSIGLSMAMLIFVIPQFQAMFEMVEGDLPLLTQIMVSMSDTLRNEIWKVVIALIILGIAFHYIRKQPQYREIVSPMILRSPVFGELLQKVALSRFARNLGSLLEAGVPVLNALEITKDTLGQPVMMDALDPVISHVQDGGAVSAQLMQSHWFPPMMVQMMAVGEETGNIDVMLDKVADYYEEEVDAVTEQLTSALEPLLIVILGGLVGTMVVGMYLPMFSIMDQIR